MSRFVVGFVVVADVGEIVVVGDFSGQVCCHNIVWYVACLAVADDFLVVGELIGDFAASGVFVGVAVLGIFVEWDFDRVMILQDNMGSSENV